IKRVHDARGKYQIVGSRRSARRVRAGLGDCRQKDRGGSGSRGRMIDRPLVTEEAERLVAMQEMGNLQRSADRAAKLVAMERVDDLGVECGAVGEGVGRVERPVADKFKRVTVVLVGSALGDDV